MKFATKLSLVTLGLLLPWAAMPECALAQAGDRNWAVLASAEVSKTPPTIRLHWPLDSANVVGYEVWRRQPNGVWKSLKKLTNADTSYTDNTVAVGLPYEYRITKTYPKIQPTDPPFIAYGYLYSGIEVPPTESRGRILLLVDNSMTYDLRIEIRQLVEDFIGDGWTVTRLDIERNAKPESVKEKILAEYEKGSLRALMLLGHIPVPYSGHYDITPGYVYPPDGHPDHGGAWPTDLYYGELDAEWLDEDTTVTIPGRVANQNIANDGKFDPTQLPDDVDLEVGRVDLSRLPLFTKNELELTRQYLNKAHAYKIGELVAEPRGFIGGNIGVLQAPYDVPKSIAYRDFSAMFGAENITVGDWFTTVNESTFLWAHGSGYGGFDVVGGVGSTNEFAKVGSKSVFNTLFGSYSGDWDVENSILRAPLATEYGLTSCWAGRPYWFFHRMALGEHIGASARLTQNSASSYALTLSAGCVHVNFLGDPTLRLQTVPRPLSISATLGSKNDVEVKWTAPQGLQSFKYLVYHAPTPQGPFERISTEPVEGESFVDSMPYEDSTTYMVRALALATTASGSYYNLSQGIFTTLAGTTQAGVESIAENMLTISGGREPRLTLAVGKPASVRIGIYDLAGREVNLLANGEYTPGIYNFAWNGRGASGERLAAGVYLVRYSSGGEVKTYKITL